MERGVDSSFGGVADHSGKSGEYAYADRKSAESVSVWQGGNVYWKLYYTDAQKSRDFNSKNGLITLSVYLILFLLCLLTVAHMLMWQIVFGIVLVVILVMVRKILRSVDYSLLFTFVGFFVFIGNVGRIDIFRSFLQEAVVGREVYASIAASQIISNVPAALLLSGFTQNYGELLIGVNLGGLGTLIASMASLISYKYVVRQEPSRKGEYIKFFTISNIGFLAVLVVFYIIMHN